MITNGGCRTRHPRPGVVHGSGPSRHPILTESAAYMRWAYLAAMATEACKDIDGKSL
jgi:hypothetical protein